MLTGEHLRFVAEAIRSIQPNDEEIQLELANHSSESVRIVGVSALAALENPSQQVAQQLRQALKDQDPKIRETAILALSKSRLDAEEKSELILQVLDDGDRSVREAAIVAVDKAGLNTAEFSKRVAKLLSQHPAADIGNSLVKCLLSIGSAAEEVLPDLLAYAGSNLGGEVEDALDKDQIARAAAALGTNRIPELLATLDTQPSLKPIVSQALSLAGPAAMGSLMDAMNSDREIVRATAVQAIGGVRPLEAELMGKVIIAMSDSSTLVKRTAIESLLKAVDEVGGDSLIKMVAPQDDPRIQLSKAIADSDAVVRATAIPSLAVLDFEPQVVSEHVAAALQDTSPEVRLAALKTIGALDAGVSQNLASVLTLTEDENASVRGQALAALGELKSSEIAENVEKALIKGLGDAEDSDA